MWAARKGTKFAYPIRRFPIAIASSFMSGPDIVLRDLNSSNGTYVNGEIISEVVLRPGDSIQTG